MQHEPNQSPLVLNSGAMTFVAMVVMAGASVWLTGVAQAIVIAIGLVVMTTGIIIYFLNQRSVDAAIAPVREEPASIAQDVLVDTTESAVYERPSSVLLVSEKTAQNVPSISKVVAL